MASERRAAIRQVLSAVAVVISLVFVGMELRQNTAAQRAQTRQELANSSRDILLTLAENSAAGRAYASMFLDRWGFSDSTLSAADSLQGYFVMFANLRNLENVWLQVREGVVGEEVLGSYAFRSFMYQQPTFRSMWKQSWSGGFDSNFVQAFEEANGL